MVADEGHDREQYWNYISLFSYRLYHYPSRPRRHPVLIGAFMRAAPVPFQRGQKKPWNSIPRIDRSHPLSNGLKIYIYDMGGAVIGINRGGVGSVFTAADDISVQNSRFGSGVKYAGTGTASNIIFPLRASPSGLTSAAPFSFAMGAMNIAAPNANGVAAGDCDAATNNNIIFGAGATTTTFTAQFNNSATVLTTGANTNSLNVFHTIIASVPNATTALIYCDGKLDQTSAAGTKTSNVTGTQFVFNSGGLNAASFGGGSNGFIYYFAGWNRALSAAEALKIHQDPYSFLIYPEDDMIATLVGAAAAGGPFADSYAQPWSNIGKRYIVIGTG